MPGGRLGPFRLDHEWTVRHLNVRGGNVIAISSYLHHYYEDKGCRVICIPPLFDVKSLIEPPAEREEQLPLTVAYAGTPGSKDLLDPILEALLQVNATTAEVTLRLVGVSPQQVLGYPALRKARLANLPGWIEATGPLSWMEAQDVVRKADFTVLLRPHLRYSEAGFPTKIAESLSLGTPVICNLTGDLAVYIRDGIEGVVCYGSTAVPFRNAIGRTLAMGSQGWLSMRHNARRRAEECFDIHHYAQPLAHFIEGAAAQAHSCCIPYRGRKCARGL
jgi:glycosyltransferase involved in cell wall biosynthesis